MYFCQTRWGEIAYQLGGDAALAVLKEHEQQRIAPGGDLPIAKSRCAVFLCALMMS